MVFVLVRIKEINLVVALTTGRSPNLLIPRQLEIEDDNTSKLSGVHMQAEESNYSTEASHSSHWRHQLKTDMGKILKICQK